MIRISHRGNQNGSNPKEENTEPYILEAFNKGFFVEIDCFLKNGVWFLGHDKPETETSYEFINQFGLFVHCKDLNSLTELCKNNTNCDFFAHSNDDWVLTRKGFLWTFFGQDVGEKSIIVDLDNTGNYDNIYGVCSDIWL